MRLTGAESTGKASEGQEPDTNILRYENITALEVNIFEDEAPSVLVVVTGSDVEACEAYKGILPALDKLAAIVSVGVAGGQLADQV